jgi:DNA-binding NtrC family response regulator
MKKWTQSETEAIGVVGAGALAGVGGVSLLVYHRDGAQMIPLRPGDTLVIGRTPPADLQIRDSALSRQHARFELVEGEVWVEDLDSTNGTLVSGERIRRSFVPPGVEVTLGTVTVTVQAPGSGEGFARLRSHDEFLSTLHEEVYRARSFERKLALLMVQAEDPEEGNIARWSQTVRRLLRPIDRMGVYGFSAVEILLPEAGRPEAQTLAQRIMTDLAGETPRLLCGIAVYPESATSDEELLEASRTAALEARTAGRDPVRLAPAQSVRSFGGRRPAGEETLEEEGPVVASPAMVSVFATIRRLAQTSIPVVIYGETGTGKEVVARAIHEQGPRREQAICCVNCGAIPDQLLESVLFGHERGAFTGAHKEQKGVFEAADGGTLLLDEIGELPLQAQTALLRVLETKRVTRIGSTKEVPVEVRVIAATHEDLEEMCKAGRFRWDLYYRLNAMSLRLPPLRERPEDIPPLVDSFIRRANRANSCEIEAIDEDALDLLRACPWPGNVRELRNVIERAVVIAQDNVITVDDLPELVRGMYDERHRDIAEEPMPSASAEPASPALEAPAAAPPQGLARIPSTIDFSATDFKTLVTEHMQQFEAALLRRALEQTGWNQTEAARVLQLPLRTLARKVKLYGLGRRRGE